MSGSILKEIEKTKAAEAKKKEVVDTVRLNLVEARAEARTLKRHIRRKQTRASHHPDPDVQKELRKEIASLQLTLDAQELEQMRNEARYKALVEA